MSEITIPRNIDNSEHQHVNREHLSDLITQTEEWAEQICNKFKSREALKLNELFQQKPSNGKFYLQEQLIDQFFLDKRIANKKMSGIYVMGTEREGFVQPFYVGISRDILVRLKNHGWGKTNYQSTLLKKMFQAESDNNRENKLKCIQNCYVYIIPIASDYDLYIQEVMLAGLLKTEWNTFRTH